MAGIREASHAGSWYKADAARLRAELNAWLADVPDTIDGKTTPISGARVVIAPHAGYSYSGPCAAWAYKALDLRSAKRVFVLGLRHRGLYGYALTSFSEWATPLGNLRVDAATIAQLHATGHFAKMSASRDVEEHSLEMHVPYIYRRLEQTFGADSAKFPPVVPVFVGNGTEQEQKELGRVLAPYLKDPDNAFVVSSDFCHWGRQYDYRVHCTEEDVKGVREGKYKSLFDFSHQSTWERCRDQPDEARKLVFNPPPSHAIHESIKVVDDLAMRAIESGVHADFLKTVDKTGNTVCGRNPIAVVMAGLEVLREEDSLPDSKGKFKFIRYERSNLVEDPQDFSVSYCAAYADP